MYIYLYIYKKDRVTEGTSGLYCHGQMTVPHTVLKTPLTQLVASSRNLSYRDVPDGTPLVRGMCSLLLCAFL